MSYLTLCIRYNRFGRYDYDNLKILIIYINLSIFIIYKNDQSIINTRSDILHLFYISVKPFLRTTIINIKIIMTEKLVV